MHTLLSSGHNTPHNTQVLQWQPWQWCAAETSRRCWLTSKLVHVARKAPAGATPELPQPQLRMTRKQAAAADEQQQQQPEATQAGFDEDADADADAKANANADEDEDEDEDVRHQLLMHCCEPSGLKERGLDQSSSKALGLQCSAIVHVIGQVDCWQLACEGYHPACLSAMHVLHAAAGAHPGGLREGEGAPGRAEEGQGR